LDLQQRLDSNRDERAKIETFITQATAQIQQAQARHMQLVGQEQLLEEMLKPEEPAKE
jgi:hypothetical protein